MQEQVEREEFTDPRLTQKDLDAVLAMFALLEEDDEESEPEYSSDEEIIKAFADGTGVFAEGA
jgi:hypothetical protein